MLNTSNFYIKHPRIEIMHALKNNHMSDKNRHDIGFNDIIIVGRLCILRVKND